MRHNKKFNHLSRTASHRAAMLSNMACSLIKYKRITTTVAKAKALRKYIEPIVTKSKNDTTHSRRVVFSYLQDKESVKELFKDISEKIGSRPGGYTRIIKLGQRQDDGAEMCFIEFVDYDENMAKTEKKARRTRRGGRRAAAKEQPAEEVKAVEETAAEAPAEEAPAEEAPVVEEAAPEAPVEEAPAEAPAEEAAPAEAPAEEAAPAEDAAPEAEK